MPKELQAKTLRPQVCSREFICEVSTKKDAQFESCELSLIWGNKRTPVCKRAPQIALKNSSKEAGGKDSIYVTLVKGYMKARFISW